MYVVAKATGAQAHNIMGGHYFVGGNRPRKFATLEAAQKVADEKNDPNAGWVGTEWLNWKPIKIGRERGNHELLHLEGQGYFLRIVL